MRVFILGAGFSADAGYPVLNSLFQRLRDNQIELDRDCIPPRWPDFESWWRTQSTWLPSFFPQFPDMEGIDLELLLTLMDLRLRGMERRREETERRWFSDVYQGIISTSEESEDRVQSFCEQEETPLKRARDSIREALTLLIERLGMETPHEGVPYIRSFVNHLNDGDIVITFNYDIEIEKAWYGVRGNRNEGSPLLKLHGSIGWRHGDDGSLIKEGSLAPRGDEGLPWEVRDSARVLLDPSYLKDIDNAVLATKWSEAADSLSRCDEVVVVGYSFPFADTAARTLITTSLLSREDVSVKVVDTSPQPKRTLSRLLSREIDHAQISARIWCESLSGEQP